MAKKPAVTPSGPAMAPPPMKKGGKAEGGESKGMHKAEMSKMKGLEKELKSHESKPASLRVTKVSKLVVLLSATLVATRRAETSRSTPKVALLVTASSTPKTKAVSTAIP